MQYSILINGKAKGRIKPSRRIRQGDPISTFMFVIAMDYLSRILQHLEERHKIKGVVINDLNLNHLFFAADILLFVENNDEFIRNMHIAMYLFECATGLNLKQG